MIFKRTALHSTKFYLQGERRRFRHFAPALSNRVPGIDILEKLFGQIVIPPTVHQELQHERTPVLVRQWAQKLPPWMKVQAPTTVDQELNVDQGEREAISLAREIHAIAILIDDKKGRTVAGRCGLRTVGTIGILEAAGHRGLLDFASVIERLRRTNARLDDDVIQQALERNRRP